MARGYLVTLDYFLPRRGTILHYLDDVDIRLLVLTQRPILQLLLNRIYLVRTKSGEKVHFDQQQQQQQQTRFIH